MCGHGNLAGIETDACRNVTDGHARDSSDGLTVDNDLNMRIQAGCDDAFCRSQGAGYVAGGSGSVEKNGTRGSPAVKIPYGKSPSWVAMDVCCSV